MVLIRHVPGWASCYTVGMHTRRPLYALKDVKNVSLVQAECGAKFYLPLQKASWLLAVKLVDLLNAIMAVFSAGILHGNDCSLSVINTKEIYSCSLLLMFSWRVLCPCGVQAPLDAHYTCHVCASAGAGYGLWTKWTKCNLQASRAAGICAVSSRPVKKELAQNHTPRRLTIIDAQI